MPVSRVAGLLARRFTTSAVSRSQEVSPSGAIPRIKRLQEHFCKEDGTPVHLKGGAFDAILYRVTMGLCVLAVGLDFKVYYDLAMKK